MPDSEIISLEDAEALITRVLCAQDVPEAPARSVAAALVAAEAEGQSGHGFSRLEDYVGQVRSGKIRARAEITSRQISQTSLLIDAGHGFAYPALDRAIDWGVQVAQCYGTAAMSVMNSHHCGALSVQVEKLAREGLIGLMVSNAPAAIAPWGSSVPVFGTNPIAFAAPRNSAKPLVIDLSLSRVARGKVMHARKSRQPIPEGWALDAEGKPTTDPEAALAGSMIAIGEAKGTALALMVEILAATLAGANHSSEVSSFFTPDGPPPGSGQFLLALRPEGKEAFKDRLEALLTTVSNLEGARLPGTRRNSAIAHARARGLDVPRHYLDTARSLT